MNKFITAMNHWLKICREPFNVEDAEEKRKEEFNKLNETIDDVHTMLEREREERRKEREEKELEQNKKLGEQIKTTYHENYQKIEEYKAIYPFIQTLVRTGELVDKLQKNMPMFQSESYVQLSSLKDINLNEAKALLDFIDKHSWPLVAIEFLDLGFAAWYEPETVFAIVTDEKSRETHSIKHSLFVFALKTEEKKDDGKEVEDNEESERGASL